MLPGFRFLFAAVVLTTSILIFGLGAAALLRAAHEEFTSIPSRRAPPETVFAQQSEARPALTMMRVDPPAAEQKILNPSAIGNAPTDIPSPEQAAVVSTPAEPETPNTGPDKLAALTEVATPAENSSPSEMPKPEASTSEITVQAEAPAQTDAPPSPTVETTAAAIAEIAPNQADVTEQTTATLEDSIRIAETKIATLGGPPVSIETKPPSKVAPAVVKKSTQAKRIVKRRRIAQRARVAPPAPRQPANPFGI